MTGIYGIRNIINGKLYVGQSSNIESRWKTHQYDLNHNRHHNKHLQAAWNSYGEDAFLFFVIEECHVKDLNGYEMFWIDYYQSRYLGYNLDLGGEGIRGYKHTEEELSKMRQVQKPRRVARFDLNMNYIDSWESASMASKALGYMSTSGVKRCCEHDKYKKAYGFRWAYEDEWADGLLDYDYYLSENKNTPRKVSQYDKHMNLVKHYESIYQACKENGYKQRSIINVLDPSIHKKAYGYVWRETDLYTEQQYNEDVLWDYSKKHFSNLTPVKQYDLDWNYIATYPSINEAIRMNPTVSKNISICFKKPHCTCGGFHWKKVTVA